MLTIEQVDRKLKIVWSLAHPISSDLTEFLKINTISKDALLEEALIMIEGDEEIPQVVWKGFLSLLKVLLDRNVKLQFSCSSEKVEAAINHFGFSLLGEIKFNLNLPLTTNIA